MCLFVTNFLPLTSFPGPTVWHQNSSKRFHIAVFAFPAGTWAFGTRRHRTASCIGLTPPFPELHPILSGTSSHCRHGDTPSTAQVKPKPNWYTQDPAGHPIWRRRLQRHKQVPPYHSLVESGTIPLRGRPLEHHRAKVIRNGGRREIRWGRWGRCRARRTTRN